METNFIALVPSFKFEKGPTFVLTCDAVGLKLLRDGVLELRDGEPQAFFVIGDDMRIASDKKFELTITRTDDEKKSRIIRRDKSRFIWYLTRFDVVIIADGLLTLLSSNAPGHQYFEVERGQYKTVVVTKDEYSVGAIRAMRDKGSSAAR